MDKVIITSIGAVITVIVSVVTIIVKLRDSKLKQVGEFSQLIDKGIDDYKEDPEIAQFLDNYKKEHFFERLIGVNISLEEIPPLVKCLLTGHVKKNEISTSWQYRVLKGKEFVFELNLGGKFIFYTGLFTFVVCSIIATISLFMTFFVSNWEQKIPYYLLILLMMSVVIVMIRASLGEIIVKRLNRAEKLRNKKNTEKQNSEAE